MSHVSYLQCPEVSQTFPKFGGLLKSLKKKKKLKKNLKLIWSIVLRKVCQKGLRALHTVSNGSRLKRYFSV